jgi:hypothetical protein
MHIIELKNLAIIIHSVHENGSVAFCNRMIQHFSRRNADARNVWAGVLILLLDDLNASVAGLRLTNLDEQFETQRPNNCNELLTTK